MDTYKYVSVIWGSSYLPCLEDIVFREMDLDIENKELLEELLESERLKIENEVLLRELQNLIESVPKKSVLSPIDQKLYRLNTYIEENRQRLITFLVTVVLIAGIYFFVG